MTKSKMDIPPFSSYQKLAIGILAIVQFTIILDFMVMAPLGDLLMKTLHLKASQFASAVSAYAFSAGISGLLAAGFADKFDRKKLLLFFYTGFILGTLLCAMATSYEMLLIARIITGLFGGVMGSISMAIISDIFMYEQRGRVMGFVQMAFAVSQVAGIPVGLYLANVSGWHAPFLLIVGLSLATALVIARFLKPVAQHMEGKGRVNALTHLQKTVSSRKYFLPFLTTAFLSIGAFMLMPFTTAFIVNNVGIAQTQLPLIYVITGIASMLVLPAIGKLSDRIGKLPTFMGGTAIAMIMVVIYTHLTPIPLWELVIINILLFAGVMSRMIPSSALMTAIPNASDRGAFMSINSSLQQIAGGIASVIAGWIIFQDPSGKLHRFDTLGFISIFVMIMCGYFMVLINRAVTKKLQKDKAPTPEFGALIEA
jgi:predicted MFS family arabinose efflux permease